MMHLRFSFLKTVLSLSGCVTKRRIRCPLPPNKGCKRN